MNRLWRAAYFVAHRIRRCCWFLTGTRPRGAFVAVWCQGRILVIKTSYQPFFTFPGGGARHHEDPRQAAIREVREEVGISLGAGDLSPVTTSPLQSRLDRNRVSLFTTQLVTAPSLRIDYREITAADFLDASDLRLAKLWPPFRAYVEQVAAADNHKDTKILPAGPGKINLAA